MYKPECPVYRSDTHVTQYLPYEGPYTPIDSMVPMLPKLAYNIFFRDQTDAAIEELSKDIRRTLRATLRTVDSPPPDTFLQQTDSFLQGWDNITDVSIIPRWLVLKLTATSPDTGYTIPHSRRRRLMGRAVQEERLQLQYVYVALALEVSVLNVC